MPRRTADVVALILATTVATIGITTAIAVLWLTVNHPEQDVDRLMDGVGRLVGVLTGALVGYMAGRRINGHED